MAKNSFKDLMNRLTHNQYYFMEKYAYAQMSAITISMFSFLYQPIPEIVIWKFDIPYYVYLFLPVMGFVTYVQLRTEYNMRHQDLFGFYIARLMDKKGVEFPVPFRMKDLSDFDLACRHPLYSTTVYALVL